ncbi:MAG: hemerythrin [Spirulina sp. DLM2.Bin59]|nr:MAG: hemerythrin [Spirulina sp. DLM2.Bin59]
MPLAWDDSLKIGIPEIDHQHKLMIDQMNLLVDALKDNKAQEEIQKIIHFLDGYVEQHFGFEEKCMHRYKCPIATTNDQAHRQFITSYNEIKAEFKAHGPSFMLVLQINQNLLDWFINHIRKIDTQLKPCMVP